MQQSLMAITEITSGIQGIWVDKVSRKLFPVVFTVFNFIYWTVCCSAGHRALPTDCAHHPIHLIDA